MNWPAPLPDGKLIAYISDVTGRYEVYLATYPTGARRRQVSVDGGLWPRWRGDGRELFYISADSLVAVDIEPGDRILIGPPRRLFSAGATVHALGSGYLKGFDVAADGQTFLLSRPIKGDVGQISDTRIVHVENWLREFRH